MRPLYRALFIASSVSRPASGRLRALLVCLARSLIVSAVRTQAPFYARAAQTVYGSLATNAGDGSASNPWSVSGPGCYFDIRGQWGNTVRGRERLPDGCGYWLGADGPPLLRQPHRAVHQPRPSGDGDNWYAYAGNNPVNKTDPSGLITQGDAEAGAQAFADGTPGLYDHWEVTNGDYAHAKYLYTTEVGFQSSISITGFQPNPYLSFPGNTGSQFLVQRLKYAKVEYKREHNIIKRGNWLSSRVGKGNIWDLKKDVLRSEDPILWLSRDNAGNFMYGAVATGDGFNVQEVLFGGGYAQYKDEGLANAFSNIFSHFDDASGQAEIAAGIKWASMGAPTYNVTSL